MFCHCIVLHIYILVYRVPVRSRGCCVELRNLRIYANVNRAHMPLELLTVTMSLHPILSVLLFLLLPQSVSSVRHCVCTTLSSVPTQAVL